MQVTNSAYVNPRVHGVNHPYSIKLSREAIFFCIIYGATIAIAIAVAGATAVVWIVSATVVFAAVVILSVMDSSLLFLLMMVVGSRLCLFCYCHPIIIAACFVIFLVS
jgi:hypothetical protein